MKLHDSESAALNAEMTKLALEVGEFIRGERSAFDMSKVQIKGTNDLVSYVDQTAESMIVERLSALLPDAGFIVEENTRSSRKKLNWIVDPLDGTTNFVHNIPCYAVSIALENNGLIQEAVVYEIARNECFAAGRGRGAFLNGQPIRVSDQSDISGSLFATGFPVQNFDRIEPFKKTLESLMRNSHGIRRIGAAAADLCYLACGRFEGFFEYNLKPWDVAAGALIVEEAGGVVSDFSGGSNWLFGGEMFCCAPGIQMEFFQLVRSAFCT